MKNSKLDESFKFYWISIIGIILYVILDATAQSLPPHYSPIRDAESDLAVGPYGYIMALNFLNRGILSLSFIYAFKKTLELTGRSKAPFRKGYRLLGCWAVGSILLAFFPTDVPATPMSWHGTIHIVLAIIAFVGAAVGILLISIHVDENVATKGAKKIALFLGTLTVLLFALTLAVQFLFHHFALKYFGLTERLFLGSVLLWILAISIYMIANRGSILDRESQSILM